jgi:hypothetical protein
MTPVWTANNAPHRTGPSPASAQQWRFFRNLTGYILGLRVMGTYAHTVCDILGVREAENVCNDTGCRNICDWKLRNNYTRI